MIKVSFKVDSYVSNWIWLNWKENRKQNKSPTDTVNPERFNLNYKQEKEDKSQ